MAKNYSQASQQAVALVKLRDAVLEVGVILPDHTPEKPAVIYGHPSTKEWVRIFLMAVSTKDAEQT